MSECIFCKIVEGQLDSKKVFEDNQCVAFDDVSPQAPVHTLVIPKKHFSSLEGIPSEDTILMGHLLQVCRMVAKKKDVETNGYRVVINTGAEGGQTVSHLHLHVLGGRPMKWPPG